MDFLPAQWQYRPLEPQASRVVGAERLYDGVVVTFDDGKSAYYCSSLLRTMMPQARELCEDDDD